MQSNIGENANISNSLLNANGGGYNFLKIWCYIIDQVPEYGEWRTLKISNNPECIIQVHDHDNGRVIHTLGQKESMEIYQTLRYHLNIVDSNEEAGKMQIIKEN